MVLITLALVTTVTLVLPFWRANSNAARMIPLAARVGEDLEVDVEVAEAEALAANGVEVFGVLAEEGPVDPLGGDAHGSHVGEQVEDLAHRDVGALDVGPAVALLGGRGRTFEGHIALVDFGEHGLGDGGELFGAALDGEAVDGAEDDSAGGDRLGQQLFEHALGFTGDGGSDAVAAEHADRDRVELGVVGRRGPRF